MTRRAFIHVQHLLGTGHAVRAVAIGKALAREGVTVRLATGNLLPPTLDTSGLEVIALPPVRALDASFRTLVSPDGSPLPSGFEETRRQATLAAFLADPVDLLLTETYPFGRRQFAHELEPLLETARALPRRPLIAASIRDILVRKKDPAKEAWMAERALAHYDRVLVHSDPAFTRLEDSFPFADRVAHLVRYTGYVGGGARPEPPAGDGADEVIVSCGGGAVARALLEAALGARELSQQAGDCRWRLLVGHDLPDPEFSALVAAAPVRVLVERARRDFPGLLPRARLSVSQAGYNTVLDVLAAGVRAVLVPFAQGDETEQTQRAEALARHGRAIMVPEAGLTAQGLAAAVDAALSRPVAQADVAMNGAAESARQLLTDLEEIRR